MPDVRNCAHLKVWRAPCVARGMLLRPLLIVGFVASIVGCGGSDASAIPVSSEEPEIKSTEAAIAPADYAATENAGGQLDPIGCRHYTEMHLKGLDVTLEAKLDAADPEFMDPDGSCGGEELPKGSSTKYPVKLVEKTSCGAAVYIGKIKWTTDGKVTRTLTLTDYRGSKCTGKAKPARVVAAITSTYQGSTNTIATYYSVDPTK